MAYLIKYGNYVDNNNKFVFLFSVDNHSLNFNSVLD